MNHSKYEIFAKTAELGSLSKAAQALSCTQSGVSRAIAALEHELSLTLLTRGRHGAVLTPEGEQILPAVYSILNAEELLHKTAAGMRENLSGRVRVGAFTSVAVHWLPAIIKEFQHIFPRVDFDVMSGDYHDLDTWLTEDTIEIGFVALPCGIPGCACTSLFKDRLMAVLPKNHRLASLKRFPMSEIANEAFISLQEGGNHDARHALELAGVQANVKFTTTDDYAIIAMVEQGLGISIMPELLLSGHSAQVRVMELENEASRTIGIAIPEFAQHNPCVQRFAAHIQAWVAAAV